MQATPSNDLDADYTPRYIWLAKLLRGYIKRHWPWPQPLRRRWDKAERWKAAADAIFSIASGTNKPLRCCARLRRFTVRLIQQANNE